MIRLRNFALCLALVIAAPSAVAAPIQKAAPVVTILGDSITAGLGLTEQASAPAQLQMALKSLGVEAVVRGAGVSGDTTAGGLGRVDFSVQSDTQVCVVELGANDYLQSVDPKVIQTNLTAIVRRLKARHIGVVLAASAAPRTGSGTYGPAFDAVFTDVARREHVPIAKDLLVGVLDKAALKQADGLHPNAAGVKIIAARLASVVAQALKSGSR